MTQERLPQQLGGVTDDDLHQPDPGAVYSELPTDLAGTVSDPKELDGSEKVNPDPAPAVTEEDDLLKKTPVELAKMYRAAQSVIGRQGNELGDLRRTFDTHIKATLARQTLPAAAVAATAPLPDEVDFFTDPKKAVADMVASHPELKKLQGAAQQLAALEMKRTQNANATAFYQAHPDAQEVCADPQFQEWVGKSKVRQALLLKAHNTYDAVAGNEVLATWKELKAARAPVVTPVAPAVTDAKRKAAQRAATVPTGGNASPTEGVGGKIYRRADIVRLMEEDPARYDSMVGEIDLAYREGRVR